MGYLGIMIQEVRIEWKREVMAGGTRSHCLHVNHDILHVATIRIS